MAKQIFNFNITLRVNDNPNDERLFTCILLVPTAKVHRKNETAKGFGGFNISLTQKKGRN